MTPDLNGFSEQGKIDYVYALPFEVKAAPYVKQRARQHGWEVEIAFLPKQPDFYMRRDGETLLGDVKAQRHSKDICLEWLTPQYADSWALTYHRVLVYCGGTGRWYWVNLEKLREQTDNLNAIGEDMFRVESSACWCVYVDPKLLMQVYGCAWDVTEQVEAAYYAEHGSTPPEQLVTH